MTKDEQINNFAIELCEACRSRHKCATEGPCTMVYIVAEELHEAGYRKQVEATWKLNKDGSGTCSACRFTQRGVWDYDNFQGYCGCCGAKMKLEEK